MERITIDDSLRFYLELQIKELPREDISNLFLLIMIIVKIKEL